MDASVLIPTRGRAAKLGRCVRCLARQEREGVRFEVLVGFDGEDSDGRAACERSWREAGGEPGGLRTLEFAQAGYMVCREKLVHEARGRTLISLNDDVRPCPGFVGVHVAEQRESEKKGRPAIMVGHSPYVAPADGRDTLLNRLVRETSMVFFYDVMNTPEGRADPGRDWGFRHCFGLNFSCPMQCVRDVGGFRALPNVYGYDDIELGFRLHERFGMPVLYRPAALAEHEHEYTAGDLLVRERSLGIAAWAFASANPAFGRAVFGRDITSEEELAYSREFVARERGAAERARVDFGRLDELGPGAVGGPSTPEILRLITGQFALLKRWTWRSGLLEGAAREMGPNGSERLGPDAFRSRSAIARSRPASGEPARSGR